jgi:hypothetical protein
MPSLRTDAILQDPTDFSLVLGGPLFQLFRRAHLCGPSLELLRRRMLVLSLLAWLPPAILSAFNGHLFHHHLSFLYDIESHVRFLVALPLLILAELLVHHRIKPLLRCFLDRGVIPWEDLPGFQEALAGAVRTRNSVWLEVALLLFTYTAGQWNWRNGAALGGSSWYANPDSTGLHLTLAGHWYSLVSIPIFQFIILRWYLRLIIWFVLLWRISRLNLRLLPTHPDRAGGIGFLGVSGYAFSPLVLAQGALLASLVASRIYYQGKNLMSFKVTILALVTFFVLSIVGPLAMFTPRLLRARRNGLIEYGTLATAYVTGFDEKWVRGAAKGEALLGSPDIQSLADLDSSFKVVREMRLIPFALGDVLLLVGAAALPVLPLLLTAMPLDEIVTRLLKTML